MDSLTTCGAWCVYQGVRFYPIDEDGFKRVKQLGCKIDQLPVRYFQPCRHGRPTLLDLPTVYKRRGGRSR